MIINDILNFIRGLTFNDIAAAINVAFGFAVLVINLIAARNGVKHKWIYYIKALAGLMAIVAFMTALFRLGKADEVPAIVGRPAFTICLLALTLGAIVTHRDKDNERH